MGNIEIKDARETENEEMEKNEELNLEDDEEQTTERAAQEPETAEETRDAEEDQDLAEAEQTEEETSDTGEGRDAAEESSDSPEKPKKKERKLKWAKAAEKEQEKLFDEAKEKLNEANDRYARLFAEFDNFRKRSEKEKAQRYDFGAKDMVERILPVIDNFERGLAAAVKEGKEEDSFVKGMEMTYKQLLKVLEDAGVKPIEAVGQEFNPDYHNAVMHVDDPEAGENVIVEEFQKGYMYKDHVVRYSMVKVAN